MNGLAMTSGGRLWVSWIAGGDSPDAFTVASRSDDGGLTWSDVELVIDGHGMKPTRGNPVGRTNIIGTFWLDPDGKFHLFTDQTTFQFDGRAGIWESVCEDPDATETRWSPPRRIGHGHLINKPIILSDGSWAMSGYLNTQWKNHGFLGDGDAFRNLDHERGATCYVSTERAVHSATRRGRRGYFACRVRSQQVALLPERARSRAMPLHGHAFGIIRTSALIKSGDETYVMEALKRLGRTN